MYVMYGAGLFQLVKDIAAHATAEGTAVTKVVTGWGAPHVQEFAWQAVALLPFVNPEG